MKCFSILILLLGSFYVQAQVKVDLSKYDNRNGALVAKSANGLDVSWPVSKTGRAEMVIDLTKDKPLFKEIYLAADGRSDQIVKELDLVFLLTVGKRDLVSQNRWNIFFDKVPLKPFKAYTVILDKKNASVKTEGTRTVITVGACAAPGFTGEIEITLYNGSPLFNVAAVMTTNVDSTAILYDAGLVSKTVPWKAVSWSDVYGNMQQVQPKLNDTAINEAVKYRTIIGQTPTGSVAVFPAPHQYFYPLDEAFNLKFTWHGNQYRQMTNGYGIGIRQDLYGDNRFVPWFNAPPGSKQRLNFFCLLSNGSAEATLNDVRQFTHNDTYVRMDGFKTMSSHFHNEYIMKDVLANKPLGDTPGFVKVFEDIGIDIVHLAEFHYTAHPKGPAEQRLTELKALFDMCERLSNKKILLLPGEEPNEFFGGHWLELFPKPVYWIMDRKPGETFLQEEPGYGKVYRIKDAAEMLELLKQEKGLAWTAHARTKGSTGFPDKYKNEVFFKSDRFMGAAWKAMPADLSQPRLGKRVLDLMDDMNNWGEDKKVIAEADLFTIEPENEMYAHLNVNYLQLDNLPEYNNGWQPVLDAMDRGKFFSTTGEVLIPAFTVNSKATGDTVRLTPGKAAAVSFTVNWTFPLEFAEIISGDGEHIFRHKIDLKNTLSFGKKTFNVPLDLKNRKWVRLEVWDAAANGAFTQSIWLR